MLIKQRVWEHPSLTRQKYSIHSLKNSIQAIVTELTCAERAQSIMNKLKVQVGQSLDAITLFKTSYDLERNYINCYCLVIAFYLDHYEESDGKT